MAVHGQASHVIGVSAGGKLKRALEFGSTALPTNFPKEHQRWPRVGVSLIRRPGYSCWPLSNIHSYEDPRDVWSTYMS